MELSTEMARLLLEVGMMAAWRGETVDARTVLEGLQTSRPDSALPACGLAVSYMNEGRNRSAADVLETALEKDVHCDMARAHLALAFKLSGFDDRSRTLCDQVVTSGRDATAVELARTLLSVPTDGTPMRTTSA